MESIDFSEKNLDNLSTVIDNLSSILSENGFYHFDKYLKKIEQTAKENNIQGFKESIINNELFGGAGAMWEIWIEDEKNQKAFEKCFCDFVDQVKSMGIDNGRVNQVREGFNLKW